MSPNPPFQSLRFQGRDVLHRPDHVILQLQDENVRARDVLDDALDGDPYRIVARDGHRWLYVRVEKKRSILDLVAILDRTRGVAWAEPDLVFSPLEDPNDPMLKPEHPRYQWGVDCLNLREAWKRTTGKDSVLIGLIDTGIALGDPPDNGSVLGQSLQGYPTHEDLADGNFIAGRSYVQPNNQPPIAWPKDAYGHGTNLAGILAAVTGNGKGMAGVNRVSPVYVSNVTDYGKTTSGLLLQGIQDLLLSAEAAGIDRVVINLAFALDIKAVRDESVDSRFSHAVRQIFTTVVEHGAILCLGGGNDYNETKGPQYIEYPARLGLLDPEFAEYAVVAGAVAPDLKLWHGSARGYADLVFAPGSNIWTTHRSGDYKEEFGTSMSTAYVAGVASLMWSYAPDATAQEIVRCLKCTARKPSAEADHRIVNACAAVDSVGAKIILLPLAFHFEELDHELNQIGLIELEIATCSTVTFRVTTLGHSFGIASGLYHHDPCLNPIFTLPAHYLADDPPDVSGTVRIECVEFRKMTWDVELRGSRNPRS